MYGSRARHVAWIFRCPGPPLKGDLHWSAATQRQLTVQQLAHCAVGAMNFGNLEACFDANCLQIDHCYSENRPKRLNRPYRNAHSRDGNGTPEDSSRPIMPPMPSASVALTVLPPGSGPPTTLRLVCMHLRSLCAKPDIFFSGMSAGTL
jgi:hypothetical protein